MYRKFIIFLFSLALLPSCQTKYLTDKAPEKSHSINFIKVSSKISKKYAACHTPEICGGIVKIDCDADLDGELVYINNENGQILMYCGGACEPGNRNSFGKECSRCPPKEWKCQVEN